MISTALDLALVVFGFGLIVFVHELGHFLAAKWAGIRVLGFALGFGPAIVSFRRGLGLRRGSTEAEYRRLADAGSVEGVSPTEYRLNWLPLGGYVRMLGQEDLDPGAVSAAPDSYQRCPVPKRMVVICAGVVMNILLAGVLFVGVFLHGLMVEPALVGGVRAGSPAAKAVALNAAAAGVTEPGLAAGDTVISVNGREPNRFEDLFAAAAMAAPGRPVEIGVLREGAAEPLRFEIVPERSEATQLLELGVAPGFTTRLAVAPEAQVPALASSLAGIGLDGRALGATIVSADGEPVDRAYQLQRAFERSGGRPVLLELLPPDGPGYAAMVPPEATLGYAQMPGADTGLAAVEEHAFGLAPLLTVNAVNAEGEGKGLRAGDMFVRLGSTEFPSVSLGIAEIRAAAGSTINAAVLRNGTRLDLDLAVNREGRVGFVPGTTASRSAVIRPLPPGSIDRDGLGIAPPSGLVPGDEIVGVRDGAGSTDDTPTLVAFRDAVVGLYGRAEGVAPLDVILVVRSAASGALRDVPWTVDRAAASDMARLGWRAPDQLMILLEPVQTRLMAEGPIEALRMGLDETKRTMVSVYLTLGRLFQGTVQVQHLRGPVGIAHAGTLIAERGLVWLLFFMALISVNLAVINFLPLPIVDGGQFLLLVAEWIRGRPVPVVFQNVMTLAGLALIGTVFLVVTFNDLQNLFGG